MNLPHCCVSVIIITGVLGMSRGFSFCSFYDYTKLVLLSGFFFPFLYLI